MENCIFCKIANGEIPSATLYEDEDFRVILDLGPASKGHALILPKAHAANIYELPDETAGKAMILAKHMATRLRDGLHCDGFNIVQNNGEIAGQTVFHFHMHLIPRYEGDQVGLTWKPGELTDEMKEEILAKSQSIKKRAQIQMIIENFDDFYDHYQGFSAYVAFCITEDYELSKDISQEVFLALFKVKEKLDYSRPDKLKALVMKATSNKCMDYYRKASSRQESYTIDDEENAYEPVDEKSNPEARILHMEEAKYQKLVLNRLRKRNPMNYDILVKTKFQELSATEVASEYGITPNNVNNRNLRSKAWIIEEMEKICRQSHR